MADQGSEEPIAGFGLDALDDRAQGSVFGKNGSLRVLVAHVRSPDTFRGA